MDGMKMNKILILCVGLGLVALVLGALTILDSTGEGDETIVAAVDEDGEREIPPIDVAAPQETETATFALG
jgi:hypothetical protein